MSTLDSCTHNRAIMKIKHYQGRLATIIEYVKYYTKRTKKPVKGSSYKPNRRAYRDCY